LEYTRSNLHFYLCFCRYAHYFIQALKRFLFIINSKIPQSPRAHSICVGASSKTIFAPRLESLKYGFSLHRLVSLWVAWTMEEKTFNLKNVSDGFLELVEVVLTLTSKVALGREYYTSLLFEVELKNRCDSPLTVTKGLLKLDGGKFSLEQEIRIPPSSFGYVRFKAYQGPQEEIIVKIGKAKEFCIELNHTFGTFKSGFLPVQQPQEWSFPQVIYPPRVKFEKPLRAEAETMLIIYKYNDRVNITDVYNIVKMDYPELSLSTFKRKNLTPLMKEGLVNKRVSGKHPGRKGSPLYVTDDKGKKWVKELIASNMDAKEFLERLPHELFKKHG